MIWIAFLSKRNKLKMIDLKTARHKPDPPRRRAVPIGRPTDEKYSYSPIYTTCNLTQPDLYIYVARTFGICIKTMTTTITRLIRGPRGTIGQLAEHDGPTSFLDRYATYRVISFTRSMLLRIYDYYECANLLKIHFILSARARVH